MGGVVFTVKMQAKFPEYTWIVAAIGVVLDGCSCFLIPWCTNYFMLMLPICILCFGIAMVDTALLPTLGYIVDKVTRIIRLTSITRSRTRSLAQKYVSVYGSVYAIADISYSAAYAIGPVIAGHIVEMFGFTALNIIVGLVSLAYAPILYFLKDMHSYKVIITLDVNGERPISHPDWPLRFPPRTTTATKTSATEAESRLGTRPRSSTRRSSCR